MGWLDIVSLLTLFLSVNGAGEFSIIQSPEWIEFNGQEEIKLSNIKNVFATNLGFSVNDADQWSGLIMKDPFKYSSAIAVVSISGVASVDSSQGHTFPVDTSEDISADAIYDSLQWAISERHPELPNITALYVDLSDPRSVENKIGVLNLREMPSTQYLETTQLEDRSFLQQIQLLDAVTTKLCSRLCNDKKDAVVTDGVPDLYWFSMSGLGPLIDTYGSDSSQVDEAKKMLTSSVLLLSEVFNTAYDYEVVFAMLSTDTRETTNRFKRQATEENKPEETSSAGDGDNENFPAMFNIFLWFNIAMVFVLIAVCYGIANMDPGRDSIIYRMTSNRMKKDN